MKKFTYLIMIAFMAFSFYSCQEEIEPEVVAAITFSEGQELAITVAPVDGIETINFNSTKTWTASTVSTWCRVTPLTGNVGDVSITIVATDNETPDDREAIIVIQSDDVKKEITLTQKQKDALILSSKDITVENEGEEFEVTVSANIEFKFEIKSNWIKEVTTKALEPTLLTFNALPNPLTRDRVGTIIITSGDILLETITVTQKQLNAVIGEDKTIQLGYEADEFIISIEHNIDCYSVNIFEGRDWVSKVSTKALESKDLVFAYTENTSSENRSAEIEVSGAGSSYIYTIIQFPHPGAVIEIPDENFKAYLTSTNHFTFDETVENWDGSFGAWVDTEKPIDTNEDGEISVEEAEKIVYISTSTENISSLVGIKNMPNLEHLMCNSGMNMMMEHNGQLTSLDLTGLNNLEYLSCVGNKLETLDVSESTNLIHLDCQSNQIETLDVGDLTNLSKFWCSKNKIKKLEVASSTNLTSFECYDNKLSTLIFRDFPNLTWLNCSNNQISTLDISNCILLSRLLCTGNQLTSLDISTNTQLTSLRCENNELTSLDISTNLTLNMLTCNNNLIVTLDVSYQTGLENLTADPMNNAEGANVLTTIFVSSLDQIPIPSQSPGMGGRWSYPEETEIKVKEPVAE